MPCRTTGASGMLPRVVLHREARAAREWPNVRDIFGPDMNGPGGLGSPQQGFGSPPHK